MAVSLKNELEKKLPTDKLEKLWSLVKSRKGIPEEILKDLLEDLELFAKPGDPRLCYERQNDNAHILFFAVLSSQKGLIPGLKSVELGFEKFDKMKRHLFVSWIKTAF